MIGAVNVAKRFALAEIPIFPGLDIGVGVHERDEQFVGVVVFRTGRFSLIGISSLRHFELPSTIVQFAAVAERKHSAHQPLAAKINRGMSAVSIASLRIIRPFVRVEHVPGEVLCVCRDAKKQQPGRDIAGPAVRDEVPNQPQDANHRNSVPPPRMHAPDDWYRSTVATAEVVRDSILQIRIPNSEFRIPRYTGPMPSSDRFATTRWSLIRATREPGEPAARQALADLCRLYWFPIYSFIRRRGQSHEQAQDFTQEFFTRLLERNGLATADPSRGRFRSYLLAACQNFLANQHDHDVALKRGGGQEPLPLDFGDADSRYGCEPAGGRTAEQEFERRWAVALLDQALAALRAEYVGMDRQRLFERIKGVLTGESEPYSVLATDLGLTEGEIKVAIHRLRQRYREQLREIIAETVGSEEEVEDEIRALFAALGG